MPALGSDEMDVCIGLLRYKRRNSLRLQDRQGSMFLGIYPILSGFDPFPLLVRMKDRVPFYASESGPAPEPVSCFRHIRSKGLLRTALSMPFINSLCGPNP